MEMRDQTHAPAALHPGENPPVIVGWQGSRARQDVFVKEKNIMSLPGIEATRLD
jgi:hypothetical protein